MSFADHYFSRQKSITSHFTVEPPRALKYVVVIPAFREEKVTSALDSLYDCIRPRGFIEVIVVINAPENADYETFQINSAAEAQIESWSRLHDEERFRVLVMNLKFPARVAGVGLARKAGMDEAAWRFNKIENQAGLIISLDADCSCDLNYFTEIEKYCIEYPKADGFNIYFEHLLTGNAYSRRNYEGIIQYELHLRYYIESLRYACFPYAYHTVGSCYAVTADAYVRQGGMNRKKSGEDFYFLHKIIPLGRFYEINTTKVIPSSRASNRVPFGTGPAIGKFMQQSDADLLTYHPGLFESLKDFFRIVPFFYRQDQTSVEKRISTLHPVLGTFLNSLKVYAAIEEINGNCSSARSFLKRFYSWFDAFTVLKYLNYGSSAGFQRIPVQEAAASLLIKTGKASSGILDKTGLLNRFREIQRNEGFVSPLQQ